MSSTSSTNGSFLFLTKRRGRTGPGCISQHGKLLPIILRRGKERNRSCGVALVEVHKSERTACNASGSTASQELLGSCFVFKISCTVFQTVWLIRSH